MIRPTDTSDTDATGWTPATEPEADAPRTWQEVDSESPTGTASPPHAGTAPSSSAQSHPSPPMPMDGRPVEKSRTWGMLAHLAAVAVFLIPVFGNVVGPLIVWLVLRNEDAYVDHHGREAVNFQIMVSLALLVVGGVAAFFSAGLAFGLVFLFPILGLLWVALALVAVGAIALTVVAAIKAYHGELYRYPFTIRFVQERRQPAGGATREPSSVHQPSGSRWTAATQDEREQHAYAPPVGGEGDPTDPGPGDASASDPNKVDTPPKGPAGP